MFQERVVHVTFIEIIILVGVNEQGKDWLMTHHVNIGHERLVIEVEF